MCNVSISLKSQCDLCNGIPWMKFNRLQFRSGVPGSGGSKGGGGGTGAPPKIGLCFLSFFLKIRMLKNKAQIARESIKTSLELPGPLSGPWTPAESEFGSALVMCVPAHNILRARPPPPLT